MRTALDVSRWLLLIPAYLMLTAFFSVWVLEFFIHDPEIWHEHFDVVLFSCSVLESIALCLACALLAPSIKRLIGILAGRLPSCLPSTGGVLSWLLKD
jgi:hypothetical protein